MNFNSFIEKQFRSTEGVLSFVEGPPNGTPVILLHGAGSRWQPFRPLLPVLAEKHHVYALDFRGHGCSSHTPGAYHLDDFARDVHQFISQQVQVPVVIYGHSLGALVSMDLAAQYPRDTRAIILGDPPLYHHDTRIQDTFWQQAFMELLTFMTDHPSSAEREAYLIQNCPEMTPERREERVRSLEGLDPEVLHAIIWNEQMRGVHFADLAARVTCPVLLLRGNLELASALREQDVYFAVTHFPDLRVLEMETIGHGIIPTALLPQMIEFIDAY
jgi:pimeloyl-ACP methyl ester carboxylesterase